MSNVKYIDIKEFREKGYLLEVNRQFLHPLGLALELNVNEDGIEFLSGIWDYRDDPEGILYSEKLLKKESVISQVDYVKEQFEKKTKYRNENYGFTIQPVGEQ